MKKMKKFFKNEFNKKLFFNIFEYYIIFVIGFGLGIFIQWVQIFFDVSRETYNKNEIYAQTLKVVDIDYNDSGSALLINNTGYAYSYDLQNDFDIYIGEYYNCIMYRNGTLNIIDDKIINIKFVRIDNLP